VGVQANLDVEVKEVKLDGLVRAESLARADVGKERIADLTGSAGDAHRHRRLRHFDCGSITRSEPCNADAQESSSVSMATIYNQSQDADPRKTKVASMWLQGDEMHPAQIESKNQTSSTKVTHLDHIQQAAPE
jgi:hypothetical protein